MSRFILQGSKWERFQARNEGTLFYGGLRELSVKLMQRAAVRRIVRAVVPARRPKKWVFIVGCYNSGTTILRRLLEAHKEIAAFPHEGVSLTDAFPHLEAGGWPRMMYANRDRWAMPVDAGQEVADTAIHDWSPWWPREATVFIEKSIEHSVRMRWLDQHFPNAYFIAITRNGLCVNEGISRRAKPQAEARDKIGDSYPPEMLARQWMAFDEVISQGLAEVSRGISIRYEDLVSQPKAILTTLFSFLDLDQPDLDIQNGTVTVNESLHQVSDQNISSLARLEPQACGEMLAIMNEGLKKHGYL